MANLLKSNLASGALYTQHIHKKPKGNDTEAQIVYSSIRSALYNL